MRKGEVSFGGGGGGGAGEVGRGREILVAFLFISPGGRLKAEEACDQSVVIIKGGMNARTNQTLVH